jgi:hypothetical protein
MTSPVYALDHRDDDACASPLALLGPGLRGLWQPSQAVPARGNRHGHRVQRHPGGSSGDVEEWRLFGPLMTEARRVDPVLWTEEEA